MSENVYAVSEKYGELPCPARFDVPGSSLCTFKTGGPVKLLAEPENEEQLSAALRLFGGDCLILGKGSNILIPDEGLDVPVIRLSGSFCEVSVSGETVTAGAGAMLRDVCTAAYENSLTGAEFAYGIPGSVGGAVYMNAGAYDGEMAFITASVRMTDRGGNATEVPGDLCGFGYRKSLFKSVGGVILGAKFALARGDKDAIKARMDELLNRRKTSQPLEFPSAGSTFKRPEGHYAGRLIEDAGLKGLSVGGAKVSEKHAGFIINAGNATSADIRELIEKVIDAVKRDSGVTLEPEVILL